MRGDIESLYDYYYDYDLVADRINEYRANNDFSNVEYEEISGEEIREYLDTPRNKLTKKQKERVDEWEGWSEETLTQLEDEDEEFAEQSYKGAATRVRDEQREEIQEAYEDGTIDEEQYEAEMELAPEYDEEELTDKWDLLERARETNDPEDWERYRDAGGGDTP